MARILCIWELGGGLGHLAALRPFVEAASARGHRVSLALKALQDLPHVLPEFRGDLFQSPYLARRAGDGSPLLSHSQLLLRRFGGPGELDLLCRAWDSVFDAVQPDLAIYNFAPSALAASLHRPCAKWVTGTGFEVPRDDLPYFGLFPRVANTADNATALADSDRRLLSLLNARLASLGEAPLREPGALYAQADRQLLQTLPEADHFGARSGASYLGIQPPVGGVPPIWGPGAGPRVFAYLGAFPGIEPLLQQFARRDCRLSLYAPALPSALRERYPQWRFSDHPVDTRQALAEADLAVTMGGHHTGVQCLLAGVPQLMIPRRQEQAFFALRVARGGGGVVLVPGDSEALEASVTRALELAVTGRRPVEPHYAQAMSGERLGAELTKLFDTL